MFKTWNLSVITLSAYLDFPTPLSPTIKIFSVVRTSFSIVPRSTPLLQSVLIPQTFNLLLKSTEIFRYIFSFRHCYFLQETRLLLWGKTADIYTRGDEGPYGASTSILIKFSLIARLRLFGEHKQRKRINHVYYVYSFSLFVSSKRRFATTIAQHNVATSFRMVTTLFQHCRACCAENRRCQSSRVTSPFWARFTLQKILARLGWKWHLSPPVPKKGFGWDKICNVNNLK